MSNLNWAVVGTGVIANEMASALANMGKTLYGVNNRTYDKGVAFAEKYQVKHIYKEYEELLADENVDVVYITTPHNTHYKYIRTALNSGKHVLAEKSITLNSSELDELIQLAKSKDLVLAEAMTIWHMPLHKELWRRVGSGELGKVQMITMNFGSFKPYDMNSRFFNINLAGGAMLDIGVYALSIVRSFMSKTPNQILHQHKLAPSGVDEQASMILMNEDGQMATVALTLHSKQPKRAMISCEKGYIEVMEYPRAMKAIITDAESGRTEEIEYGNTGMALQYEIEDMEKAIITGDQEVMKLDMSRDVMNIMTKVRKEWGLAYPEEE